MSSGNSFAVHLLENEKPSANLQQQLQLPLVGFSQKIQLRFVVHLRFDIHQPTPAGVYCKAKKAMKLHVVALELRFVRIVSGWVGDSLLRWCLKVNLIQLDS